MSAFWLADDRIAEWKQPIPQLIGTLLAGLFGFFMTGSMKLITGGKVPGGVKISLQAGGGFAVAALVWVSWPSPRAPHTQPAQITSVSGGDLQLASGRGINIQAGGNVQIKQFDADDSPFKKIVNRYERILDEKDGQLRQKELEIAHLHAALARTARLADRGNAEAKAAIEEARASGDITQLQIVLMAEADRREKEIKETARDYIEISREIAAIAKVRGDLLEADKRLHAILRINPDDADAIRLLGDLSLKNGDLAQSEKHYLRVLELSSNDETGQAMAYRGLGAVCLQREDLEAGQSLFYKALTIHERLGLLNEVAYDSSYLGAIHLRRGDLDAAENPILKAIRIKDQLGQQAGMALDYWLLGVLYRAQGDTNRSEEMHRKSVDIFERVGWPDALALNYGSLGKVYDQRGDVERARAYWTKARDLYAKNDIPKGAKEMQDLLDRIPAK